MDYRELVIKAKNTIFDMSHQDLSQSYFDNAQLTGVSFKGSDLSGTSFRNAKLHCCNFTGAHLWWTDFRGADLWGSTMDTVCYPSVKFDESTILPVDSPMLLGSLLMNHAYHLQEQIMASFVFMQRNWLRHDQFQVDQLFWLEDARQKFPDTFTPETVRWMKETLKLYYPKSQRCPLTYFIYSEEKP